MLPLIKSISNKFDISDNASMDIICSFKEIICKDILDVTYVGVDKDYNYNLLFSKNFDKLKENLSLV